MNADRIKRRWIVALHEAGHLAAHIEYGQPLCGAFLLGDESGLACAGHGGLSIFGEAVYRAAGPAAEKLADDVPPPPIPPPSADTPELPEEPTRTIGAEATEGLRVVHGAAATDAEVVARACILRLEKYGPPAWADRYNAIQERAAAIVSERREAVIAMARRLFIDAAILPSTLRKMGIVPERTPDEPAHRNAAAMAAE